MPTLAHDTTFSSDSFGISARRGRAILLATHDSLPRNAGSSLRCVSCHLDEGTRPNAIPLTGVYARFPKYFTRSASIVSMEDRVNNCFTRSLAGRALAVDSRDMRDVVNYLAHISDGVPIGAHVPGEGLAKMPRLVGDAAAGATIYAARCSRCHAADGSGIPPATPLWGPRSFSIGASMAREERAASFIRHNMPFDSAGVLSDQQAYDVAAFVVSHPRPDAAGKEHDWPAGDAPYDVPYATRNHVAYRPPPHIVVPARTK